MCYSGALRLAASRGIWIGQTLDLINVRFDRLYRDEGGIGRLPRAARCEVVAVCYAPMVLCPAPVWIWICFGLLASEIGSWISRTPLWSRQFT